MLLRLSQAQLNLIAICPRKFQHIYLDQLSIPTTLEQQERLIWGSHFHLLMQQQELGLLTDSHVPAKAFADESDKDPLALSREDQQLKQYVDAFLQAAPEIFQSHPETLRQSEHRRTLEFQGYLFTVIYDLLLLDPQQAQILDWKTYPRPQHSRSLLNNWQTRLYPFILVETSDYLPEQVSMTYWFVQGDQNQPLPPQSLKFSYSTALHQQIHQELVHCLSQLTEWLQRYEAGEPFPQVNASAGHCETCPFAVRCQRQPDQVNVQAQIPLAEIQEVVL